MAYEDFEDRETGLDRSSELYEEIYDSSGFGERIDPLSSSADSAADDPMLDDMAADDAVAEDGLTPATSVPGAHEVETGFGETIATSPHLEDQLDDTKLNEEAESDYSDTTKASDTKDESLMDKAKDKINEWTGSDKEA